MLPTIATTRASGMGWPVVLSVTRPSIAPPLTSVKSRTSSSSTVVPELIPSNTGA